MKYIEFFASALTLLGVWFISEKLYIIGFTIATLMGCVVLPFPFLVAARSGVIHGNTLL